MGSSATLRLRRCSAGSAHPQGPFPLPCPLHMPSRVLSGVAPGPCLPASPPATGQSSRPGEAPCSNTPAQGRLGGKLTTAVITSLGAAHTVGLQKRRTLLGTTWLSPRPPRLLRRRRSSVKAQGQDPGQGWAAVTVAALLKSQAGPGPGEIPPKPAREGGRRPLESWVASPWIRAEPGARDGRGSRRPGGVRNTSG